MIIRKKIKAGLLKEIIKLPDEIEDEMLLDLTIEETSPAIIDRGADDHRKSLRELKVLFQSRIRAAGPEENCVEEVFRLDEVAWEDLNEIKANFELEGYGVQITQKEHSVRVKILWRYV